MVAPSRRWLAVRRRLSKRRRRRVECSPGSGAEQDARPLLDDCSVAGPIPDITTRPRHLCHLSDGDGTPLSDGSPLSDDILVSIFAGMDEISDLVRISATCRRWSRLVSSSSHLIARTHRPAGRYLPSLAVGFFYQPTARVPPRFASMASATLFHGFHHSSLNTFLDDGLFHSSRLVASRDGLLVVDLRGGGHDAAICLCVCNPLVGTVDILPPLPGKEGGHYACTVLTEGHEHDKSDEHLKSDPPPYRLLLLYSRVCLTVCRTYSSRERSWSAEISLKEKSMEITVAGTVIQNGTRVCWIVDKHRIFWMEINTYIVGIMDLPLIRSLVCFNISLENHLLGVCPDGSLCAIVLDECCLVATAGRPRSIAIQVHVCSAIYSHSDGTWKAIKRLLHWKQKLRVEIQHFLPAGVAKLKLRFFCERSGLVFFVAWYSDNSCAVYSLSLDSQQVEIVSVAPSSDPWHMLIGMEMNDAAFLATLGKGDDDAEQHTQCAEYFFL